MYKKYEALRNEKGMTDAEVSRAANVPPSTLYDWKADRYTPKADKLMRIAEALGVSIEYFLK